VQYNAAVEDILKEFCADGFKLVPRAVSAGARRIELCMNLEVGGTTPSPAVIEECVEYCAPRGVDVATMVRPRGGNFVYNGAEKLLMSKQLELAICAGSNAVVLGALTESAELDFKFLEQLAQQNANRADLAFHMAFDELLARSELEAFKAVDQLIQLGFRRILTHGGSSAKTILENVRALNKLINYASGSVAILPGGGITTQNLRQLSQLVHAQEFHGTRIVF
jgi:copper homeostasis protein